MSVITDSAVQFEFVVDVLIIGGGACGLTAAVAASDGGAQVLVLERDKVPLGTTAMSTGLIPAAATRIQREAGIEDDAELFANDLLRKSKGTADADYVRSVCTEATETIDWLSEKHSVPFSLFEAGGALPGHSRSRLHGTPSRTGEELIASLLSAAENAGADVMTSALVSDLIADGSGRVTGVVIDRPDGSQERVGCRTLVLATCGFAGNAQMVADNIPELTGIMAHTHPGATGDALRWGLALGAKSADLGSYQGHGNVAAGHGLLLSWLSVSEGGFQVSAHGERFSDESRGYSEQAVDVGAQPDGFAWTIYDARIDEIMSEISEYRELRNARAMVQADTIEELAVAIRVPIEALTQTMADIDKLAQSGEADGFGRIFHADKALKAPFFAAKVNPALFHTQGGLVVDQNARVIGLDDYPLPNLFAGGGAARGLSGAGASGYVAGNGLMSATTLGKLAGRAAASQALAENSESAS